MTLRNIRERHRLLKIRKVMIDIKKTISNCKSDYTVPLYRLCEARTCLGSESKTCLKTVKEASKLFLKESEVARKHDIISDRLKIIDDTDLNDLDARYHSYIRSGDYKRAEKILRTVCSKNTLFKEFKTLKLSVDPEDGDTVLIRNETYDHISIDSLQLSEVGFEFIDLKQNIELWPRQMVRVPMNGRDTDRTHVIVSYYSRGSRHSELYELKLSKT